jgi:streptomycin 6-kinase
VNDEFRANALRHGEQGLHWLNQIPEIIAACEQRWSLRAGAPFSLSWAYVAPATRADGTQVVLKIAYPENDDLWTGIEALRIFAGDGITALLDVDAEHAAILLERATPGIPLSALPDDEAATRVLAAVMPRLWKPLPAAQCFITIAQWAEAIPLLRRHHDGSLNPIPERLLASAEELFAELIATAAEPVLVHGDLHHDNVISSGRAGWLAIDPKGVAAERAYETAAMLRNPYDRLACEPQPRALLRRRIEILSEELGFDARRIQQWGFAQTVLSAVWSVESGRIRQSEQALAVAEALDEIRW